VDFVPLALINRVPGPTGPWFEKSGWEGAILTETTKEAEAKLSVSNAYNTSSREITITVTGKFLKEATDNENLALYLIENELVGEQDSASVYLPNYHHKNILRDMILGTYGEKITTAIAGAGFNFTKTYTHTLPATLAPENCSIVAVLQNGDTKLVRQAASAHILP
jgi:hypothetical protein